MWTFDADYINHNNHRKHANRANNRVSMPTRLLGRVRNDFKNLMDSQNETAVCFSGLIYHGKMLNINQVVL